MIVCKVRQEHFVDDLIGVLPSEDVQSVPHDDFHSLDAPPERSVDENVVVVLDRRRGEAQVDVVRLDFWDSSLVDDPEALEHEIHVFEVHVDVGLHVEEPPAAFVEEEGNVPLVDDRGLYHYPTTVVRVVREEVPNRGFGRFYHFEVEGVHVQVAHAVVYVRERSFAAVVILRQWFDFDHFVRERLHLRQIVGFGDINEIVVEFYGKAWVGSIDELGVCGAKYTEGR